MHSDSNLVLPSQSFIDPVHIAHIHKMAESYAAMHRDQVNAEYRLYAEHERAAQLETIDLLSMTPWEDVDDLQAQLEEMEKLRVQESIDGMIDRCVELAIAIDDELNWALVNNGDFCSTIHIRCKRIIREIKLEKYEGIR